MIRGWITVPVCLLTKGRHRPANAHLGKPQASRKMHPPNDGSCLCALRACRPGRRKHRAGADEVRKRPEFLERRVDSSSGDARVGRKIEGVVILSVICSRGFGPNGPKPRGPNKECGRNCGRPRERPRAGHRRFLLVTYWPCCLGRPSVPQACNFSLPRCCILPHSYVPDTQSDNCWDHSRGTETLRARILASWDMYIWALPRHRFRSQRAHAAPRDPHGFMAGPSSSSGSRKGFNYHRCGLNSCHAPRKYRSTALPDGNGSSAGILFRAGQHHIQ
ncbi:hypothetical protein F5884DRAFT_195457 [Xylogone sp. PMI_703]|nr:hypothetical protein F5884DRAFT_195457 [Xylogone sp. PMI_703]